MLSEARSLRTCTFVTHLSRVLRRQANNIMSGFASEKFLSDADAFMAVSAVPEECDAEQAAAASVPPAADAPADDEAADVFSPSKGNLAFSSAVDGWAFLPSTFAPLYAHKLGVDVTLLAASMWGEARYLPKSRRLVGSAAEAVAAGAPSARPLFVALALEPLWQLYAAAEAEGEGEGGTTHQNGSGGSTDATRSAPRKSLAAMAASLGVAERVAPRDLASPDRRAALRAVLRAWLPLPDALLGLAVAVLPSPRDAAPRRMARLAPQPSAHEEGSAGGEDDAAVATRAAMQACDPSSGRAVCFVSKVFAAPPGALPPQHSAANGGGSAAAVDERFLAFTRVFSGTLRAGDEVIVLPPGWTQPAGGDAPAAATNGQGGGQAAPQPPPLRARVTAIYLMMGRGLHPLDSAPAGSIVAVAGLDTAVLKCATLVGPAEPCGTRNSTTDADPDAPFLSRFRPLCGMFLQAAPTVRVAVEPLRAADLPQLLRGLRLLHRADPAVELEVTTGGEAVLGVAGEVHLQRCLADLRERFARVDIAASQPLVAYRESVALPSPGGTLLEYAKPPWARAAAEGDEREGATSADVLASVHSAQPPAWTSPGGGLSLSARAWALPSAVARVLDDAAPQLRAALCGGGGGAGDAGGATAAAAASAAAADTARSLRARLGAADEAESSRNEGGSDATPLAVGEAVLRRAWACGPHVAGPNVLLTGVVRRTKNASPGCATPPPHNHHHPSAQQPPPDARFEYVCQLGAPTAGRLLGFAPLSPDGSAGGSGDCSARLSPREADAVASLASACANAFQLVASKGPLCDEPLWGVALQLTVTLHAAECGDDADTTTDAADSPLPPPPPLLPGSHHGLEGCRRAMRSALLSARPRLVEHISLAVLTLPAPALGGAYAVLRRRRGAVLRETGVEGAGSFVVAAELPMGCTFGLADELRQHTAGNAAASLVASHWARFADEEPDEDSAEQQQAAAAAAAAATQPQHAAGGGGVLAGGGGAGEAPSPPVFAAEAGPLERAAVNVVRKRKGLPVEEKLVVDATKQRTHARKK